MALVVFGAVRSSPGTTTAALAVGGCMRERVLVEGDPDGAVLNTRFGLAREPNLASFAANLRAGSAELTLLDHTQTLPGGLPLVAGLASADRAVALWRSAGTRLAEALASARGDVLLDAGRLAPTSPLLGTLPHAALTLVVARPIAEDLYALANRLEGLREASNDLAVVLVGDRPYGPSDVASQLGVDVLGVIARDERAARALAGASGGGGGRALRRSALARSARDVAGSLLDRLAVRSDAGSAAVMPA